MLSRVQVEHEKEVAELGQAEALARERWEQETSRLASELAEKAGALADLSQESAALQARLAETEATLGAYLARLKYTGCALATFIGSFESFDKLSFNLHVCQSAINRGNI